MKQPNEFTLIEFLETFSLFVFLFLTFYIWIPFFIMRFFYKSLNNYFKD